MLKPGFLLQALPAVAIFLAAFIFIMMKLLSRLRPRDGIGSTVAGGDSSAWKARAMPESIRFSGTCPVVVRAGKKSFEAEAREISLAGAFIVCDPPLPVGELLELSLVLAEPVELQAAVTWNNKSVPVEDIVVRGMRVRFLHLSEKARAALSAGGRPAPGFPPG